MTRNLRPRLAAVAMPLVAFAAFFLGAHPARGADHTDSPAATSEPLADIADYFAWMNSDASRVNMIITVNAFATNSSRFGDALQYVFHASSRADFGATAQDDAQVVCQFYTEDAIECWVLADDGSVVDYVEGDPSATSGLVSTSGGIRVYAGLRDDPFFFNLDGFNRTVATVRTAAGGLVFDAGNCPTVDVGTSTELVRQLTHDANDAEATNDLAGANILALVVQVDKARLTTGGPIVATWASTHRAE